MVWPAAALVWERRRRIRPGVLPRLSSFSLVFCSPAADVWEFSLEVVSSTRTTLCGGDPVLGPRRRSIVVSSSDDGGLLRYVGGCLDAGCREEMLTQERDGGSMVVVLGACLDAQIRSGASSARRADRRSFIVLDPVLWLVIVAVHNAFG